MQTGFKRHMITSKTDKSEMTNPVKLLHDTILPPATKRWPETRESDGMPLHRDLCLEGEREHIDTGRIIDHTGTDIGEHRTYRYRFNQGDRHEARVYRVDSRFRSPVPLLGHSDLAFLTLLDGLNDYCISRDARLTGLDHVAVGSNQGVSDPSFQLHDLARLPDTFRQSLRASLSRSAIKSQLITNDLQEIHDLPKQLVKRGKSQGAILTPVHYAAAPLVKNEIVYSDSEAPVLHERLFTHPGDMIRLAGWGVVEGIGVAALAARAFKNGTIGRYKGTTNLDPNFQLSNLIGGIPSLTSGEFAHAVSWVPKHSPMHFTVFRSDLLSTLNVIREQFTDHPNAHVPTPEKWWHTHNLGLTDEAVMDEGSMRVNALQHLVVEKPNPETRTTDDYNQIYDMEPGMGYSIPHAASVSRAS